jgi:hypothetical protein
MFFVTFALLLAVALILAAIGNRDAAVVFAFAAVSTTLVLRVRLQVLARRELGREREERGER